MLKKMILFTALLGLLLALISPLKAYAYETTADMQNGYTVFTIAEDDPQRLTINCDSVAAGLMSSAGQPGMVTNAKIKIVNNSQNSYRFKSYQFYTDNMVSREVNNLPPAEAIRTDYPPDTGAIGGVRGFDENRIPFSMTILRCVNSPLKALYGEERTDVTQISLEQVLGADEAARKKGFSSYADYLLDYYRTTCSSEGHDCHQAETLYALHPMHIDEILGTKSMGCDGQSEIRQPRSYAKSDLRGAEYLSFRQYGWGKRLENNVLHQPFEVMEADPELIQLGYVFLYDFGLRFSFDSRVDSLEETAENEIDSGGMSIRNFMGRTGEAHRNAMRVLKNVTIQPGETYELNRLAFCVQVPNAFDKRSIDFGFTLTLGAPDDPDTDLNPDPPPNPDSSAPPVNPPESQNRIDKPQEEPKTGNVAFRMLLGVWLSSLILLLWVFYRKRKLSKQIQPPSSD